MSSNSSYIPPSVASRLTREVRDLLKSPFPVEVDPDSGLPANLQQLTVELEGPADTPYAGKFFLLRIAAGHDFPSVPPAVHFLTKVYHPNVDPVTGAVCVNTLKKDWKSTHTMSHVLSVIRCLLIVPFPESSLNEDAGRLLMESYDEYCNRARLHADVHGRIHSIASKGETATSNSSSTTEDSRVLQTSSRNTAGTTTTSSSTSSISSPNKVAKKGKSKTAMTKKKSLKRL